MWKLIGWVALGSGLGGVLRFVLQQRIYRLYPSSFPWGTLVVNVSGCLLIGVFYALSEKGNLLSPSMRLLLTAGFCGGFTTFSTFTLENIMLLGDGELLYVSLYTLGSIILGFAATFLGIFLVKSL